LSGGGIEILDFGEGSSDDLAIRNPTDRVGGTVNVLYGSGVGVTDIDQLWHQDVRGIPSRARSGEGFGGGSYLARDANVDPTVPAATAPTNLRHRAGT
jgi:hypothetical protein